MACLQRRGAVRRGVARVAGLHRLYGGGANVRRRIEIRLAGAQAEHIAPGRAHFARQSRYGDGGGRLDALNALGKLDGAHDQARWFLRPLFYRREQAKMLEWRHEG